MDNFEPPAIPGDTSSPANAYVEVLNQQYAVGLTKTLSSRSLLEVRVGVSKTEAGKTAFGTGGPEHARGVRHHGPADRRVFQRRPDGTGVAGWTTWGRQNSNPQYQNPFVVDIARTIRGSAAVTR